MDKPTVPPLAPGYSMNTLKASNDMRLVFGSEFADLHVLDRQRVMRDYMVAYAEDKVDGYEYARRIGKGNLASYLKCLKVDPNLRAGLSR